MAAAVFDEPIATVTIVDADRVWFAATHGLEGVTQIGADPDRAPPRRRTDLTWCMTPRSILAL